MTATIGEYRLLQPRELRQVILGIPSGRLVIPDPSPRQPEGRIYVDGDQLRLLDMFLMVGGFRISEAAKPSGEGGNTSDTIRVTEDTHHDTKEKVLRIQVVALKKLLREERDIGVPLNPIYDPFTQPILDAFKKRSEEKDEEIYTVIPWDINRFQAARANRHILRGIGYTIRARAVYRRDAEGKLIKEGKKKVLDHIEPQHPTQGADHIFRHARTRELRLLQLKGDERRAFFKWSKPADGAAAVEDSYDEPLWFEFFGKLLRPVM